MKAKYIILCALVVWVISCAPPMRVRLFPGHQFYAPTSPASVDVLRREPRRPHEAFAEIRYEPPAGMSRFEAERILKEKAAQIGADALIIEVDNVYHESVWVGRWGFPRRTVYRERILIGIAIRYH